MDWAGRYRRAADEPPAGAATPDGAIRLLLHGNAEFVREVALDAPAPNTSGPPAGAVFAQAPTDPGELTALGRVVAGYPAVARHLTPACRGVPSDV